MSDYVSVGATTLQASCKLERNIMENVPEKKYLCFLKNNESLKSEISPDFTVNCCQIDQYFGFYIQMLLVGNE